MPLKIDIIFTDILSFGKFAGYPTTFVHCTDPRKKGRGKNVENVVNSIINMRNNHVSISGDSPLMQEESLSVVYELISRGFQVSIDADLSEDIDDLRSNRTFSYCINVNCPSSGRSKDNRYSILPNLISRDIVSFDIEDHGDYIFAKEVLRDYPTRADIVFNTSEDMHPALRTFLIEDKIHRGRLGYVY